MKNEEMAKTWEEMGETMKKVGEILREGYKNSFWFRCWVRWDNLVFSIKHFFKKTLPNFTGYMIYRIKHPHHSFVTCRDY